MKVSTDQAVFTPRELAKRWGVHVESLLKLAREGKVPGAFRLSYLWRFRISDVLEYEERAIAETAAATQQEPSV